jgi:two-component system nitrate/nitrite response regulator NarL
MTPSPAVRLLVVDDHTLFRRGLIALLARDSRLNVVAEAGDAGEALKLGLQHQPDVVLLDNHLPGVHGVEALPQLCAALPGSRMVMLTVSEDADDLAQAFARGAVSYLLKTIDGDDLVEAIVRVMAGESVVSPEMTGKLVAAYRSALTVSAGGAEALPLVEPASATTITEPAAQAEPVPDPGLSRLSPRERDILREIARGASNKEIARTLQIAETTVKIHVQHILRKLNLTSRVQAAVFASTRGG